MISIPTNTSASPCDRGSGCKDAGSPLVIGHRGCGYLPEHTLEAYALAIELGADYVEPDLVATADGVLIARHEPNMLATTDIASRPEFAARKRTLSIDASPPEEGFFACDFSLAEIRRLRAVQPMADREQRFNGRYGIPTLDEIIALVKSKSREKGRSIGIYPETKHPTWHASIGLALEDRLLDALVKAGWNDRAAPVFIQSFEQSNLEYLRSRSALRLIQLIDAATPPYDWSVAERRERPNHLATPEGLAEVRAYADGIGPSKRSVVGLKDPTADARGAGDESRRATLPPGTLIDDAHDAGLLVHAYTFRNEPRRLAADYRGDPVREYLQFFELGVDGVFSDFADTAVAARATFRLLRDEDYARRLVGGEIPR